MKYLLMSGILLLSLIPTLRGDVPENNGKEFTSLNVDSIYKQLQDSHSTLPAYEVFNLAVSGFQTLKRDTREIQQDLLTLIDFSLSSNEKRLWVIDLEKKEVLYHDLVAHGKNSGNKFARKFSNVPGTNMSSLGFYITGETYYGKHGLSLFLNGKDPGFNENARKRAIVMHGANYVSETFIRKYGRLGRSFGCPSVPMSIYKDLIKTIADGTCLFIYYPDRYYLQHSRILKRALSHM